MYLEQMSRSESLFCSCRLDRIISTFAGYCQNPK
jgi:hypothetical protein